MKTKPVKVKLSGGYADKAKIAHKDVIFSKILKGRELFSIDELLEMLDQSESETLLSAFLLSNSITKFGSLNTPVGTDIILSLDKIDFEDLASAYQKFIAQNGSPKPIADDKIQLVYGFECNGVKYDVVEFGKLTTGKDALEAENNRLSGNRGTAFLAGKEIARISQSKGKSVLEGSLSLEQLSDFAAIDLLAIMEHSKIWKQIIRTQRAMKSA